jgi:hypothetical protein
MDAALEAISKAHQTSNQELPGAPSTKQLRFPLSFPLKRSLASLLHHVHNGKQPFVGQPILAAAGLQPARFASVSVGFCRKRRFRQGWSVTPVKPNP